MMRKWLSSSLFRLSGGLSATEYWVVWQNAAGSSMTTYMPFDRDQPFLCRPDLKDWLPKDDIAVSSWPR